MADGKWVMTPEDSKRVDLSFDDRASRDPRGLPNFGRHIYVDDRAGSAERKCAFCSSDDLDAGAGGYGEGFGYRSCRCGKCGGTTDFVYKDEAGRFF